VLACLSGRHCSCSGCNLTQMEDMTEHASCDAIGYFEAGISKDGAAVVRDAKPGESPTLWLAFKWEGLQPLGLYASTPQQAPVFFWMQRGGTPDRTKMLR